MLEIFRIGNINSLSRAFPFNQKTDFTGPEQKAKRFKTNLPIIYPELELQCHKRGMDDYVQIGGSSGLDNSNMILADSLCGLNSKPG